jgi:hypothetical protein
MSERVCRAIRVEIQPVPLPPGHTEIREFVTWPFEPPKEGKLVYLDENGFPIDDLTLQAGHLITEPKSG